MRLVWLGGTGVNSLGLLWEQSRSAGYKRRARTHGQWLWSVRVRPGLTGSYSLGYGKITWILLSGPRPLSCRCVGRTGRTDWEEGAGRLAGTNLDVWSGQVSRAGSVASDTVGGQPGGLRSLGAAVKGVSQGYKTPPRLVMHSVKFIHVPSNTDELAPADWV